MNYELSEWKPHPGLGTEERWEEMLEGQEPLILPDGPIAVHEDPPLPSKWSRATVFATAHRQLYPDTSPHR